MKILFTRFPLESAEGGAERQTFSLIRGLKDRGHDVQFLGSCHVLLEWCSRFQIPNSKLDIGPPPVTKWGAVSFAWRQFGMREKLQEARSKIQTDAVVMLSLSEKLLLNTQSSIPHSQIFWLEHDPVGRWLTKNPWLPRLRKLSRQVTTIGVSELSKKIYVDLGWDPEKVIAIPNGIDVAHFPHPSLPRRGRVREGTNEQRATTALHIGTVSRFAHEKGIDLLLRAIEHLPNVQLRIVGKGPEESALKKLAHDLGIADRVRFETRVDDLTSFYQSLDAFVLSSRTHDPFGLVAAEAMALGVPTIVTDMCGIASHLKDDEALIVPADSTKALIEAILKLGNPELRAKMSAAGSGAICERFTCQKMVDAYEQLLTANK